ncbi:MAG: hypothetical protein NT031_01850 [Planctomycetota bacterium]|nr:hypothetical protein [Planctomycetota bacterium]
MNRTCGVAWMRGILALCLAAAPMTAAGADSRPASASAPARSPESIDTTSRIASNFGVLVAKNWPDALLLTGRTVLWAIVWAVLLLPVGMLAGLVSYLLCRKFLPRQAPQAWYRYARWLLAAIFLLAPACGFAYGGAWLGAGRSVRGAIRDDRVLDKLLGAWIIAALMDSADYQATGEESAEQMQKILADSSAIERLVAQDWAESVDRIRKSCGNGIVERTFVSLVTSRTCDALREKLQGLDPRVLVLILRSPNVDQYIREHPNASPGLVAFSLHFGAMRQEALGLVGKWVWAHLGVGIALGLLGPIALASLLRLAIYLSTRKPAVPH